MSERVNPTWTTKYPFTEEAREYIRLNAPSLEEFVREELNHVVEYTFNRLKTEIEGPRKEVRRARGEEWTKEYETLFYPLAFAIVKATGNGAIQRVFADRESKKALSHLRVEEAGNVVHIGRSTFNLRLNYLEDEGKYLLQLMDYLSVSSRFGGGRWKLSNSYVKDGWVYLDHRRACRIIAEYVKRRILMKMGEEGAIPDLFLNYSEKLIEFFRGLKRYEEVLVEDRDWGEKIDLSDLPPCIRHVYDVAVRGGDLSHMARFSLVTFLSNVGYGVDEIVRVFSGAPDFSPQKTRYQVEHITGMRGGRKKYKIPSCSKMRTFNLCMPGEGCRRIKHPMHYLRRKRKK
ncbi:MAG: hypothetical protein ACE5GD_00285 [Candidatus Geothermarchaeales archaeon]